MERVNAEFLKKIKTLGAFDINACFSCGNCTAICPLSDEKNSFPRKMIRYSLLGLEEKIITSPDPWLCYYCGECTETCPREADPGGLMMALRRFATTKYDFTGISPLIYLSKTFKFIATLVLMLLTVALVYFLHGPIITSEVKLATFAPVHITEIGDLVILFLLGSILLINIYRMYRFIVLQEGKSRAKIPLKVYIKEFINILPLNFFTQLKFKFCENKKYWITHLIIVYGYGMAFILVVFLLRWFQTDEFYPFMHPIRILGYFSAIALLYGVAYMSIGRIKHRKEPVWKFSHSTDWMFLILLFLTTLTGLLVDVFKYLHLPMATYITYTIHLAVVTPLLVLEVPFAKWSHLAYRPFAIYFARLKEYTEKVGSSEVSTASKSKEAEM
ncbi:MAG: 4Fe-4S dicluster domain-containing protein [Candidatus Aminicenantes bacterium]|nr:4Fe-4S dicluster domain-containing protein [Candidatus Aminicenantes bacterium]